MVSTLVVDSGRDAKALAKEVEAMITKQLVILVASECKPVRPGRRDIEGAVGEMVLVCFEKSILFFPVLHQGTASPIDANTGG